MNELENKIISKKVGCMILKIILVFGIIMIAFSIPSLIRVKRMADRMICGADLLGLGKAIKLYADDFNNGYPSPEKWCDLLIEKEDVVKKQFCPHKKKANILILCNQSKL